MDFFFSEGRGKKRMHASQQHPLDKQQQVGQATPDTMDDRHMKQVQETKPPTDLNVPISSLPSDLRPYFEKGKSAIIDQNCNHKSHFS